MALNSSGQLSIGGSTTGESINLELGKSASATSGLGDTDLRSLAGVSSGPIVLPDDFWGKSDTPCDSHELCYVQVSKSPAEEVCNCTGKSDIIYVYGPPIEVCEDLLDMYQSPGCSMPMIYLDGWYGFYINSGPNPQRWWARIFQGQVIDCNPCLFFPGDDADPGDGDPTGDPGDGPDPDDGFGDDPFKR